MKVSSLFLRLILMSAAAAGGWFAARHWPAPASAPEAAGERRILYYQSAMHPWIKSDQPGKCTICGMDLTPVYEGDPGFSAEPGIVALPESSVTVLNVRSVPVVRGELVRSLRFAGTIDDDETRHRILSAYVPGRVDHLSVNYLGAEVQEGQPLAEIYSPELLAAEREYVELLRGGGSPGIQTLAASARQKLLRMGLLESQIAELPGKPAAVSLSQVLAPLSGTVVARHVYEGQYVAEGDPLFEIADFSRMWFVFRAYEQDLPYLQPGLTVEVTTPSIPGKVYTSPISFIDPNLDDPSRSVRVRVELENPLTGEGPNARRELLHKLYAEGTVSVRIPDLLLVPRSAVLSPAGIPVVYIDQGGGAFAQRHVELGRQGDDTWEVLQGLATGEKVVVSGNLMIDAQAQLNQATDPSAAPPAAPAAPAATLTLNHQQLHVLTEFLQAADAVRAALASDDLPASQRALELLQRERDPLLEVLRQVAPDLHPKAPTDSQAFQEAATLADARRAFHPLSLFLVDLAAALRAGHPAFTDLKIYECPMTDSAFPQAPPKSAWFQLSPPLRNPWFGAEMLECGQEIRP